jgi:hypothetical protein
VGVSGHERYLLPRRQGQQVIVRRIRRLNRWKTFGIGHDVRELANELEQVVRIRRREARTELGPLERTRRFLEQRRTHDELDLGVDGGGEQGRRCATSRKDGRDENVRVEDNPHALGASGLVLRLDCELHRLVLVEVCRLPDAVEQL